MGSQECPEVSVLQVFVDDTLWLLPGAHSKHPGDVDILQSSDYSHFVIKLNSGKLRQNFSLRMAKNSKSCITILGSK